MKIILVRHGESEGNVAHLINDDPSQAVNLTERGRTQAEAAADDLRSIRFTHAYASQFSRAQQTADILLRAQACTLSIDARLNERRSGMNGLPVHMFNDLVAAAPLQIKPSHGESFLEQMERVRSFLDEIAVRHPAGMVLAVSHENPILAALALSSGEFSQVVCGKIANCQRIDLEWPAVRNV
jgi:broad specificity phosphatase PhoE